MSVSLHCSLRGSQPQDENAMTSMRPGKTGGLAPRGSITGGTVNKPPAGPAPAPAPLGQKTLGGGMQPASRRALGDITNAGGGGSSGSGGLGGGVLKKSQPALVASIKPLSSSSSPAPLKQKAPQQKLSAPIQLVSASSIPSAAALADDDEDLSWMHVDQAKGDGLGHLRALDHAQEEVATQASQALVARLGDGKMFRPNSPIPWERTEEETNYNALLTAQLPSASDLAAGLAAVDDFELQF